MVYYNGRRYFASDGQIFEGDTKMFRMSPRCSYHELKKILYMKLRLQRPQTLSRLFARTPSRTPVHWVGVEVVDNDDVALVVDAFRSYADSTHIEFYAEVTSGGEASSQDTPPSLDFSQINTVAESIPEDIFVSPPPPPQTLSSTMIPTNDMYDPTYRTDSSEDEVDEALVPDSDSSDTDVDGDFERAVPNALSVPIPSPGIVGTDDPPLTGSDNVVFWSGISHFSNINWSHPDQELDDMQGAQVPNWQMGDKLYKDQVFENKQDVQMAIKQYCMADERTTVVQKSDTKRLIMVCENHNDGCPWRMRAYQKKGSTEWIVGIWNNEHTCLSNSLTQDHKQLDSTFICSLIIGGSGYVLI